MIYWGRKMKITFVGQIENKKTGLGKALNDIILYSKNELGKQKIEQIDITHNTKFLEHIFRILTSTSDVYYFTPSGSKLGVWRDSFYLLAMNLRKKRVICHFHNSNFGNIINKSILLRVFSKLLYQNIDQIILLGSKQKEMFNQLDLQDEKYKIIHNGVDDFLFMEEDEVSRKQHNKKKNIIYFSNMLPEKGYQFVLESAEKLKDKESLTFYFSGKFFNKEFEDDFLNRISELPNVRYLNGVYGNDKKELLRRMNIFILPSFYKDETLPISMLEAMASGCYIIVSDVGVISEVVNPDTTILLSKDDLNSQKISNKILEILPKLPKLDYKVGDLKKDFENRQVQSKIFEVIVGNK